METIRVSLIDTNGDTISERRVPYDSIAEVAVLVVWGAMQNGERKRRYFVYDSRKSQTSHGRFFEQTGVDYELED